MPSSYSSESNNEKMRSKYSKYRKHKKHKEKSRYGDVITIESPTSSNKGKYSSSHKSENSRKVIYTYGDSSRHHHSRHRHGRAEGEKSSKHNRDSEYKYNHRDLYKSPSNDYEDRHSSRRGTSIRNDRHRVLSPESCYGKRASSRDSSSSVELSRRVEVRRYSPADSKRYKEKKHEDSRKGYSHSSSSKDATLGYHRHDRYRDNSSDFSEPERRRSIDTNGATYAAISSRRRSMISPLTGYSRQDACYSYRMSEDHHRDRDVDDRTVRDRSLVNVHRQTITSANSILRGSNESLYDKVSYVKDYHHRRNNYYEDDEEVFTRRRDNRFYNLERELDYIDTKKQQLAALNDNNLLLAPSSSTNNPLFARSSGSRDALIAAAMADNDRTNNFYDRNRLIDRVSNYNRIERHDSFPASIREYYMRGIEKLFAASTSATTVTRSIVNHLPSGSTNSTATTTSKSSRYFKKKSTNKRSVRSRRGNRRDHDNSSRTNKKISLTDKDSDFNENKINFTERGQESNRISEDRKSNLSINETSPNVDVSLKISNGLSDISDADDGASCTQERIKSYDNESESYNGSVTPKLDEAAASDKLLSQPDNMSVEDVNEYSVIDELTVDLQKQDDDDKQNEVDSSDETDLFTVSRVSDKLGVDWESLVAESKKDICREDILTNIRTRWEVKSIVDRIGVSLKYAGKEIFENMNKKQNNNRPLNNKVKRGKKKKKSLFLHEIAAFHVCLKGRADKMKKLFDPCNKALSLRSDIAARRQLNNLPVKNIELQKTVGICNWIV